MSLYKRGEFYWYHFIFNEEHVQRSTKQGNRNVARQMEAAHRTALAKGEVGIREKKQVPNLESFRDTFMAWVRATKDNERTQEFYETCYQRLLDYKPLARATLDRIDEPLLEDFKQAILKNVSRTTCNRYLSTLKKALRHAQRKLKLIDRLLTEAPDLAAKLDNERFLEQLSRQERDLLDLKCAGHTDAEVAKMRGIPVDAAESQWRRLRRKLRKN